MPVMLQLPGAFDLQPLTEASACSNISSPLSSCSSTSELLEIVSPGRLQLAADGVLLGNQLVFLRTAGERDDAIELRRAQIQIARTQRGETVVDRPLLVDLHRAFGKKVLDRRDSILVQIRRDLFDRRIGS